MPTAYKSTFVMGQQIQLTLFSVNSNNGREELKPLIEVWDKLEVEVQIKSKKNRAIGMCKSRTQAIIEGFRLTLVKAKADNDIESLILSNQAHMHNYQANIEYLIRLTVNHTYSKDSVQAPEAAKDGNSFIKFVQNAAKPIIQSILPIVVDAANQRLKSLQKTATDLVVGTNPTNGLINSVANKLNGAPILQRGLRFVQQPINNALTNGVSKLAKDIKIKIPQVANAILGLQKFGISTPEVFQEVYDFHYCTITADNSGYEPKDFTKHSITFEASEMQCSTTDNALSQYIYNEAIQSKISQMKTEQTIDNVLNNKTISNPSGDGKVTIINDPIQVTYPTIKTTVKGINFNADYDELKEQIDNALNGDIIRP